MAIQVLQTTKKYEQYISVCKEAKKHVKDSSVINLSLQTSPSLTRIQGNQTHSNNIGKSCEREGLVTESHWDKRPGHIQSIPHGNPFPDPVLFQLHRPVSIESCIQNLEIIHR